MSSVVIEPRSYGPDSTEGERKAIQDRISVYRDDILLMKAMPITTLFSLQIFQDRINELTAQMPTHCILIDLSESQPLEASSRAKIQEILKIHPPLHVALFNARNPLFRIAAQFIFSVAGVKKQSMHQTFEQALEAIERARQPQ